MLDKWFPLFPQVDFRTCECQTLVLKSRNIKLIFRADIFNHYRSWAAAERSRSDTRGRACVILSEELLKGYHYSEAPVERCDALNNVQGFFTPAETLRAWRELTHSDKHLHRANDLLLLKRILCQYRDVLQVQVFVVHRVAQFPDPLLHLGDLSGAELTGGVCFCRRASALILVQVQLQEPDHEVQTRAVQVHV